MRLINADAFEMDVQKCVMFGNTACIDKYEVLSRLHNATTIDAVPVVRCKDCKLRDTFNCGMQFYGYDDDLNLYKSDDWTMDDGFCYWGERKDV